MDDEPESGLGLEADLDGIGDGSFKVDTAQNDYIDIDGQNSPRVGSFIEAQQEKPASFIEDVRLDEKPDLDQEYRSDDDQFEEVKVEAVEEGSFVSQREEPTAPSRREPEEEYFMLAVLALKFQHTEQGDAEYIYEIDGTSLFQDVKEKGIAFHMWHKWLEAHFDKLKKASDIEAGITESEETDESPPPKQEQPAQTGIFAKIYSAFSWRSDTTP